MKMSHRLERIPPYLFAELERKVGQMTMENDFLKKTLQHFRDHHPPAVVNGAAACIKKSGRRSRKAKP